MRDWICEIALPLLSLLTSAGTLFCCALPALLVTLGMGAVLAGVVSNFPALVVLTKNKEVIFLIAAALLAVAGWMQWKNRYKSCAVDVKQAMLCMRLRKISLWIYILSLVLYAIGFFFAFIAVHIFY